MFSSKYHKKNQRLIKERETSRFLSQLAYGNFKDLPKRTGYDNVLRDKALNIAKNQKCNWY